VADARGDLVLAEQHDIVEQIAAHGKGQLVVEADAAAKRIRQRRSSSTSTGRPASRLAFIAAPASSICQ